MVELIYLDDYQLHGVQYSMNTRKTFIDPCDDSFLEIKCSFCGKKMWLKKYFATRYKHCYCNKECKYSDREITSFGEKSRWWKGGRIVHNGYVYIKMPSYLGADSQGYVKEHRMIMETHLGRSLLKKEVVHHINGIKTDNRLENLIVMITNNHSSLHVTGRKYSEETINKMKKAQSNAYWKNGRKKTKEEIDKRKETMLKKYGKDWKLLSSRWKEKYGK